MKLRTLTLLLIIIYQISTVLTLHLRTQSEHLRKKQGFVKTHISGNDMEKFIQELSKALKDEAFVTDLGNEFKQSPEHFNCSLTDLPVEGLTPTQSQIGLHDSLEYVFDPTLDYTDYFSTKPINIVGPIITLNGEYIIDGHHRWSQLYLVNKKARITAIDCKSSTKNAIDVLKKFQLAIGALIGKIPSNKVGDHDIYQYAPEDYNYNNENSKILTYLKEIVPNVELPKITDEMYNKLVEDVSKGKKMKMDKPSKIAYFFHGLKKTNTEIEESNPREQILKFLFNEITNFKKHKKPIDNAPMRKDMPQVDKVDKENEKTKLGAEMVSAASKDKNEPKSPVIKLLNRHDISIN